MKTKQAAIKLVPSEWQRGYWNAQLLVPGRKKPAFTTVTLRMKRAIAVCLKVAKDNGYTVPQVPKSIPSGLTQEDRDNISRLQDRKYQVGLYGDDRGVRDEQRSIQSQINHIKDAAKARAANGLMGSNVKPMVPLNLYIDK